MTNTYGHPFAVGAVANTGYDAGAVTALQARLTSIINLLKVPVVGGAAHPDFDKIPAATRDSIVAELTAMSTEITAH